MQFWKDKFACDILTQLIYYFHLFHPFHLFQTRFLPLSNPFLTLLSAKSPMLGFRKGSWMSPRALATVDAERSNIDAM